MLRSTGAPYRAAFLRAIGAIAALGSALAPANAQIPGPGMGDTLYTRISNPYLTLDVGLGKTVAGTVFLYTSPTNPSDPSGILLYGGPQNNLLNGTKLFVRVDGGAKSRGADYIFGDQKAGTWISPPTVFGNHIEARWQTLPAKTASNASFDPKIEIDLVASLIHDTARFEFSIVNNGGGEVHNVALAFTEDIDESFTNYTVGAPVRPSNGPYYHKETVVTGSGVPKFLDVFVPGNGTTSANVPQLRTIRATLQPLAGGETEPTPPTRIAYGDIRKLNAGDTSTNPLTLNYDVLWNFNPDPNVKLEGQNGTDSGITLFWDAVPVSVGQKVTYSTLLGQATADGDYTQPVSLAVASPAALGLKIDRTDPNNPKTITTPNPFTISAFVQNLTDLNASGGISIGPVNLFLDLPAGLKLDPNSSGETASKQIANLSPGAEGSVSWNVISDGTASGTLTFRVTATPNVGTAKTVARDLQVPAPPTLQLHGTTVNHGQFQMISVPLDTANALPSSVLNLRATDFDLVRFNPLTGRYEPQNSLVPGFAYWIRSRLAAEKSDSIDSAKYPPLQNQVQPGATSYPVTYTRGWNQIGDPFVYPIRFSEVQLFDDRTFDVFDTPTAADASHQLLLQAVYHYNTSDPDYRNWHYELLDNLGFVMIPGEGYWIYLPKRDFRFIYPGTDQPNGSVSRAARLGAAIASGLPTNAGGWRLQLTAKGEESIDPLAYIGTASRAADTADRYKLEKPPTMANHVALDIVHDDFGDRSGRFAQDIRSANGGRKVWKLAVTPGKENENITLSWPHPGGLPRSVALTLRDLDSGQTRNMRGTSSYAFTADATTTRHFEVVAAPTSRFSGPSITTFDITSAGGRASAPSAVTVHYGLAAPADISLLIRDGSGRKVRTVVTRAAGDAQSTSGAITWDLRDNRGASVAPGVYQVELQAITQDGQRSRQVRPYVLTR